MRADHHPVLAVKVAHFGKIVPKNVEGLVLLDEQLTESSRHALRLHPRERDYISAHTYGRSVVKFVLRPRTFLQTLNVCRGKNVAVFRHFKIFFVGL